MFVNQQVKIIYNELVKRGKVKSVADFAEKMAYTQPQISNVFNDKRNAGKKLLQAIIDTYNVNEAFFITSNEKIFKDEINNTVAEPQHEYGKKKIPFYEVDFTASEVEVFNDKNEKATSYIYAPGMEDCDFSIQ